MRIAKFTIMLALLVVVLTGCAGPSESTNEESPPAEPPAESPAESPSSGLRLAPGLYDIEGGKVQAMGTLAWKDLEGGFWVVVFGPDAQDEVIAVIANSQEFQRRLEPLKGKVVLITGTRVDGASIRMAGPEIEMESVKEMTDTPGIAE